MLKLLILRQDKQSFSLLSIFFKLLFHLLICFFIINLFCLKKTKNFLLKWYWIAATLHKGKGVGLVTLNISNDLSLLLIKCRVLLGELMLCSVHSISYPLIYRDLVSGHILERNHLDMLMWLARASFFSSVVESEGVIKRLHSQTNCLKIWGVQQIGLLTFLLGDNQDMIAANWVFVEKKGVFLGQVVLNAKTWLKWLQENVSFTEGRSYLRRGFWGKPLLADEFYLWLL